MIADDLIRVRTAGVCFHVLRDVAGLVLIDGGFIGGERALEKALQQAGWNCEKIVGVIVTHGHLDHILNVGKIARKHGAWIAAPRLDAEHYLGKARYRGWSRATGLLEKMGRALLDFETFKPDRWIDEGDFIDVWDGLKAVSLPGHTAGHTGYFCERRGLLFSADLFASYHQFSHLPPRIFNSDTKLISSSISKALSLGACGVLPNHGDDAAPEIHLERLRQLAARLKLALPDQTP